MKRITLAALVLSSCGFNNQTLPKIEINYPTSNCLVIVEQIKPPFPEEGLSNTWLWATPYGDCGQSFATFSSTPNGATVHIYPPTIKGAKNISDPTQAYMTGKPGAYTVTAHYTLGSGQATVVIE